MSAPTHHTRPRIDIFSAVTDFLELLAVCPPDELEAHVSLHSCEPDHQIYVELASPVPGLRLTLTIDLDAKAAVTGGQILATAGETSRTMMLDGADELLRRVGEVHFTRDHPGF